MAQRNFDLIVFDWDGTLMDSTAAIAESLQAACADLGLAVPPRELASHVIGLSLMGAVQTVAPGLDEAGCQKLVERYRYHFLARDHELVLFEGVRDLLDELREQGRLLAVATGKARRGLDRVLEQSGLAACFDATRCADESFSKPHPAMLLELMDELLVPPERTVMIGDTTHDLLMARNAGTPAVAVSHGAHPVDALAAEAPLAVLGSIADLRAWLACHG
ncbi:HAD-IIIA family hydrolase [Uliginosibacterium paludis]|uniref:HAD-IIIA family hydrolase n=1 Tax=Uliginosibacterium paludis TaxID=1615952 RepID=A0ABV2CLT7_9RHOO